MFTYLLARRKYCHVIKRYNPHFLGMSLLGRVLHREGEHIRIHFDIDEHQDVERCYSYPWKPEVGNLMYIAPQVGSRVSVYFGEDDESTGIATVNVRDNAPPAPAKGAELPPEPDYEDEDVVQSVVQDFNHGRKGLRTEHGKSFNLFPGAIRINSNRGLGLSMNSNGMSLFSNANVSIIAKNDIRISASNVKIESSGNAYVVSGVAEGASGAAPKSELHLFSKVSAMAQHGAFGDPAGGIKYLASSGSDHDGFFDDEPGERTLNRWRIASRAATAAVIVVAVGGLIIVTGGKALLAANSATKIGANIIVTGCMMVAGQLISDLTTGVESGNGAFAFAAMQGMFIGLIAGAAGVMPGRKVLGALSSGAGGSMASQLVSSGELSAEKFAQDMAKSMVAFGLTSALFPGSGKAINNAMQRARAARKPVSRGVLEGVAEGTNLETIQNLMVESVGEIVDEAQKAAAKEFMGIFPSTLERGAQYG